MSALFTTQLDVRWADVDANRHMRHSAYADFAGFARAAFFDSSGFDIATFAKLDVGPILFREELIYRREILMFERITITSRLASLSSEADRWSIHHELIKPSGEVAATINVDGAWLDLPSRKLCIPPAALVHVMLSLEKTANFTTIETTSTHALRK